MTANRRLQLVVFVALAAILSVAVYITLQTPVTSPPPPQAVSSADPATVDKDSPPALRTAATPVAQRPFRAPIVLNIAADPVLSGLPVTRVSVDFDSVAFPEAFDAFTTATHLAVSPALDRWPAELQRPITLHLKDVSLLEAVLAMRAQVGNSFYNLTPTQLGFQPERNETIIGPYCIAGPFAVVVEHIQNVVDLTNPNPAATAALSLRCLAEPTLKVLQGPLPVESFFCVDENGAAITAAPATAPTGIDAIRGRNAGSVQLVSLTLTFPQNVGQKMATLKGFAPYVLSASVQPLSIDDIAQPFSTDLAGLHIETTARLERPVPTAAAALNIRPASTFQVRFSRTPGGPISDEAWANLAKTLPVVTANYNSTGTLIKLAGHPPTGDPAARSGRNGRGGTTAATDPAVPAVVAIEYTFNGSTRGPPSQITLDVPTAIDTVRVPFEFHDLAIP